MKYIYTVVVLIVTFMYSVAYASEVNISKLSNEIEQNLYVNLKNHIKQKIIDTSKPKIREKIISKAYDVLPSIYLANMSTIESTKKIYIKDNMVIKDMCYKNSILSDTSNVITYNLDGKYDYFTSYVGLCDVTTEFVDENVKGVNLKLPHPLGNVMFSVIVDDVLVYFSSVMNSHSLPEYIYVNIKDKQKLVLIIENMDERNNITSAWIEPTLYKEKLSFKPCSVEYKKKPGTFLYCNNPESIKIEDTLDKGKIIYETGNVLGNTFLFAEQNNSTEDSMYYGVIVENEGSKNAKVVVKNKGMSKNCWTGLKLDENCWRDFCESKEYTIEILPNESRWLVDPVIVSCYNQYTGEGVVNLAIDFESDMPLNVRVVAFTKDYDLTDPKDINGKYLGYVTRHENFWGETRNYKGRSNYYPKQECVFTWEIDDNTKKSYLPVRYKNLDRAGWITHITKNKHTSAVEDDMYTFVDPNGLCFGPYTNDYSTMTSNLGNWAVTYKEIFNIKNNSNTTRSIDIIQKNAFINSGVIVITPSGDIIKSSNACDNIKTIATIEAKPHEVTQYEIEYIIPACSVGGLTHYVKIN
ncbi:MAG: NPCBM/NEW2 domain-containing protein [Clostridiales bacterium]|nr:NPCBM/NEW2 domain-containing protein [Clostridiales bacterium]